MDKAGLLAELDTFYVIREPEESKGQVTLSSGYTIDRYHVPAILIRTADRTQQTIIVFYVYREGEAQEAAYYEGDPISHIWEQRVEDYLAAYQGERIRGYQDKFIARLMEGTPPIEKWVLVTASYSAPAWNPANWSCSHEEITLKEFVF